MKYLLLNYIINTCTCKGHSHTTLHINSSHPNYECERTCTNTCTYTTLHINSSHPNFEVIMNVNGLVQIYVKVIHTLSHPNFDVIM